MGDRVNIVVREALPGLEAKEAVFLYGHWSGSEAPFLLQKGLRVAAEGGRITDEPYLARILFEALLDGNTGGTTSYGISTRLTDNEYPLLVVYAGRVYVLPEKKFELDGFKALEDEDVRSFSVEEYLALDLEANGWAKLGMEAV